MFTRLKILTLPVCLLLICPAVFAQNDGVKRKSTTNQKAETNNKSDAKTIEDKTSTKNLEDKLAYPELEVAPRASDRLEIEAKYEARYRWLTHLPIQFSSLMTLYAASNSDYKSGVTSAEKDNFESAQTIATGIGSGWLVTTLALSAMYRPYLSGLKEVNRLPKGESAREQLARERIAEEALYEPAGLATKLKWFSVASQLYATLSLLPNSDKDSKLNIGIAAAASLTPLLFEYRWSRVARTHKEYKKKIYGPIGMIVPPMEPSQRPAYALLWSF